MGIYNLFSFIYPCIPQALLAVLPPINSLKFFLSNLYPANNAKFNNIHLKYTCMGICSPNIQFIPTKSSLSGHRAYKCIKYTLHAHNKTTASICPCILHRLVYNNCNVNILTGLNKPKTQQLSHTNATYRLFCPLTSLDKSNVFVNILTIP